MFPLHWKRKFIAYVLVKEWRNLYSAMPHYRHAFTHLHTATGRTHWNAATRHRAPNKPLLLLTVIDLFAQELIILQIKELQQ